MENGQSANNRSGRFVLLIMLTVQRCVLCGGDKIERLYRGVDRYFSGRDISCDICLYCSLVFLNPRPEEKEIEDYYRNIFQDKRRGIVDQGGAVNRLEKSHSYEKQMQNTSWLFPFVQSSSRCLEVGGGYGTRAKVIQDQCQAIVELLEPSQLAAAVAKDYYGLVVHPFVFADYVAKEPTVRYSFISLFHVFEHLAEPRQFLRQARGLLEQTGRLVVVVPDLNRPDTSLDRYFHIEHFFYYTPRTLTQLFESDVFKVIFTELERGEIRMICELTKEVEHRPVIANNEYHTIRRCLRFRHWRYQFLRWAKDIIVSLFILDQQQTERLSGRFSRFFRRLGLIDS